MMKYFVIVIIVSFVVFFVWHYLFSIYEVKIIYDFNNRNLKMKKNYCVKCVGLNSFGHQLSFRDLDCQFNIIQGAEIIKSNKSEQNKFCFTPITYGKIVLEINSKFSLLTNQLSFFVKTDSI